MTPAQVAAGVAALVLALGVVFQILLAAGLPLGAAVWGGTHRVLPARLRWGSAASALVLGLAAWMVLARAGIAAPGAESVAARVATQVFAWFFALNTLGNLASRSSTERRIMGPATLLLLACFAAVALSPPAG